MSIDERPYPDRPQHWVGVCNGCAHVFTSPLVRTELEDHYDTRDFGAWDYRLEWNGPGPNPDEAEVS